MTDRSSTKNQKAAPVGARGGKQAGKNGPPGKKGGGKKGGRTVRAPQDRPWGWIAAAVALAVVCIGGVTYAALNQGAGDPSNVNISGVKTWSDLSRDHTTGQVNYNVEPPVGGKHNPMWAQCTGTVYDEPVNNENAVHSLEHGAVWITYQPDLPKDQRQALADKVKGQPYTMMSPYPGQDSPIVVTAWEHQLKVDSADDERIGQFLRAYVKGPQTQEPGASCSTGRM